MSAPPAAPAAKVLIVEDEPSIARCLAHFLQVKGFDAVVAPDATVAMGLLGAQRWDVVVLDQLLGRGLRGDEVLAAAARRDPDLPARTIFMTGDMTEATFQRIGESRCRTRLDKPFSLTRLLDAVREVVAGEQGGAGARRRA